MNTAAGDDTYLGLEVADHDVPALDSAESVRLGEIRCVELSLRIASRQLLLVADRSRRGRICATLGFSGNEALEAR